jgi:small subunit ribosomal protein S21
MHGLFGADKVFWRPWKGFIMGRGDILRKIGEVVEKCLDKKIPSGRIKLLSDFDETGIRVCNCLWFKQLSSRKGHDFSMLKVKSRAGESVQQMMRRFKKLCEKEGLIRDMKRNAYYEKPSEKNRRRIRKARRTVAVQD